VVRSRREMAMAELTFTTEPCGESRRFAPTWWQLARASERPRCGPSATEVTMAWSRAALVIEAHAEAIAPDCDLTEHVARLVEKE